MAGTVNMHGTTWTASSGLFYWVVDTLAERVASAGLAAHLREISDNNLGWLDVADLPVHDRAALEAALGELPAVADRELPDSEARDEVVARVRALAALAARPG